MKIEMFKDKARQWRWRLRANNGNILASSEAYSSKTKAHETALSVLKYMDEKVTLHVE